MDSRGRRSGLTLVELLVVTAMLAGLLGLVLTAGRPSTGSQVRQMTQAVGSAITASQSRALGKAAGAALVIARTSASPALSTAAFFADIPPLLSGTVSGAGPIGGPVAAVSAGSALVSGTGGLVTFSLLNADSGTSGYRMRFFRESPTPLARSPWFVFSAMSATSGTVTLDSGGNQTIRNTIWPVVPANSGLQFELVAEPRRSSPAFPPGLRAAIDLRFSGVGDSWSAALGSLRDFDTVAIVFDRTGRLDCLIGVSGTSRTVLRPTAPLYLLIAPLQDIQGATDELTSLKAKSSRWLAIAPGTGRTSFAANVPVTSSMSVIPATSQTTLIAALESSIRSSRANARQGITGGAGQ